MQETNKATKVSQQKLPLTGTSQPKQQLSKTHLLALFQTKKIKTAKQYISQLKNSNPRAEKAIKQSLQEIFCYKKVSSATAYMYALVFYKNLLISCEMDYYQDETFFSNQIHQAVIQNCSYNPKQKNLNQRGADFFSYALRLQQKQNEDIQATGKAVVIFSLELIQTMAQIYKESYMTGQESIFTKRYKQLVKSGVTFPKKQNYLYIKQHDIKQFTENYQKLLQQIEDNGQQVQKEKNQQPLKVAQSEIKRNKEEQVVQSISPQQKKSTTQLKKETPIINKSSKIQEKKQQKLLSKGVAEILRQVQEKKQSSQIKKQQTKKQSQTKKPQQNLLIPQQNTLRNEPIKPKAQTVQLVSKLKQQEITNIDEKQTSRKNIVSTLIDKKAQIKRPEFSPKKQVYQEKQSQKQPKNDQKQISSEIKKSFKRTQVPNSQIKTPQKNFLIKQPSQINKLPIQTIPKDHFKGKSNPRPKHKIFQQIKQKTSKININTQQKSNQVSDSIVSFSPIPKFSILDTIRSSSPKNNQRSVPKTQKKHFEKNFFNNFEYLAQKLNSTQKSFGNHNKKSFEKFPTKTLSAWRCQKSVKKQKEPAIFSQQMMDKIWGTIRQKKIPFVPEYFYPTTLKMSALRRASLQLFEFNSNSEVFFNNGILSARLMKPSQNYFILSLGNISGKDFRIRVFVKQSQQVFEERIKFVDEDDKKQRLLREGGFMDVRFVFVSTDLNFKFLAMDFQIDDQILSLQMPVTLLDSCRVSNSIEINQLSQLIKKPRVIYSSQAFRLNKNDLPKFLSFINSKNTARHLIQKVIQKASNNVYFTLRLKSNEFRQSESQNILFCRLTEIQEMKNKYLLSFMFDCGNQDTQSFAKVMLQLLVFLLYQ